MSSQQKATSARFFVQMLINVFLCNRVQSIISKRVLVQEKISKRSILIYVSFAIFLLIANQATFMFFKDLNLYQKVGASRSLNIAQLKIWGDQRRAQLFRQYAQNPKGVQAQIKELQEALNVLTHPARRLTYDSFGYSDVEYAWAFKFPSFILSTIIGSGSFFVICTFVSLMNKKKADLKEAFKVQIFAMILLFIWEVDLIISTESRIANNQPDFIDYFYKAFPIFERREMLKAIVIPCMSLVQIFVRFFMISPSEKKMLRYGCLQKLQAITRPIRDAMGNVKIDANLESTVKVELMKWRQKQPLKAQIYDLQRDNLKLILNTNRQQFIPKQMMARVVNYFILQ